MNPSIHSCHHTRSPLDSQSMASPWQVLVADDEKVIHSMLDLALKNTRFNRHPICLTHAFSLDQAKERLRENHDIALVLLDISMNRKKDGLDLVKWIRTDLGNTCIQIVLCTKDRNPQREKELVDTYDINNILVKTRTTHHDLEILVKNGLRNYKAQSDLAGELNRRKEIESKLEKKKAQLKDLIENIGDMVWETDQNNRFTFISGNPENQKEAVRFMGQPYDHGMTREARSSAWPRIQTAMAEQKPFSNIEISRRHSPEETRYYLSSGKPLFNGEGQWEGFRGAEKEITNLVLSEIEKKRLISQLRQAQRLEAMGTLAGGIAHDFNNILGGILGYTQLIQFEMKDHPTALSHTEHIISGCNRAKNLILQILDFSRQREGTARDRLTNPVTIVDETVKLIRASIPSSIKIKTETQKDTGIFLADPSQIHQAVMNLCTNAHQAIESGMGEIHIRVFPVTLSPANHIKSPELDLEFGDYIGISVSDTGTGMETETLEKIFNPYFTTKKRGDGTGLGLSVVHGIVTRFNGAIKIKTHPGQGSCFTLYFPKYEKKPSREKENRPQLKQGRARVLFIDDEPMLVDIGRMMLEKLGYGVTAVEAPLKGLELLKEDPNQFDIIITDMTMPDIHGTQLAVRAKAMNPGLLVVLATGFSNIVRTREANPAGIDAVLPKPITMASLSQTLYQLTNP